MKRPAKVNGKHRPDPRVALERVHAGEGGMEDGGNSDSNKAFRRPVVARASVLPVGVLPIGLSRVEVAALIGVSPTKADQMVADGRLPKPKRIDGRRVWDSRKVIAAFDALDGDGELDDPWGRMTL